jgi:hypothetical protein
VGHSSSNVQENSMGMRGSAGKDRVSFGTNMSTKEETSDRRSVEQVEPRQITVIERFHARKFRNKEDNKPDKKAILKVGRGGGGQETEDPSEGLCERGFDKSHGHRGRGSKDLQGRGRLHGATGDGLG